MCIVLEIQIASDEPLQLPWDWLAQSLLYAPAAGLKHYLETSAPQLHNPERDAQQFEQQMQHILAGCWGPQLLRPRKLQIDVTLQRPAEAGQLQEIMCKTLCYGSDRWSGDDWPLDAFSVESYYPDYPTDAIYVKPNHMQKVAITGSWCQALPKAGQPLWRAHHGCHLRGVTVGDDIAVDIRELAEPFEQCADFHHGDDAIAPSSVNNFFKPFTCEIAGQSDWSLKRQQAKQRERVKRVRAAGRKKRQA